MGCARGREGAAGEGQRQRGVARGCRQRGPCRRRRRQRGPRRPSVGPRRPSVGPCGPSVGPCRPAACCEYLGPENGAGTGLRYSRNARVGAKAGARSARGARERDPKSRRPPRPRTPRGRTPLHSDTRDTPVEKCSAARHAARHAEALWRGVHVRGVGVWRGGPRATGAPCEYLGPENRVGTGLRYSRNAKAGAKAGARVRGSGIRKVADLPGARTQGPAAARAGRPAPARLPDAACSLPLSHPSSA